MTGRSRHRSVLDGVVLGIGLAAVAWTLAAYPLLPVPTAMLLVPTALCATQSALLVLRIWLRRAPQQPAEHLAAALDERRELQLRLAHETSHDQLTGLANRTLLTERVDEALARRTGTHLVLVDLDRFSDVNDAHGHQVGDSLLTEVAGRLHGLVTAEETLARLGVDQFAMLIEGDREQAEQLGAQALDVVCRPYRIDGTTIRVSGSAGLLALEPQLTASDALRDADAALQEAKRAAGSRVVAFEPALRSARRDHTRLTLGLREALAGGEFSLAYQPIVDLTTRRIRGVESLLRWTRPDGEVVSPVQFIPVAEQTGLIGPIGAWVLAEACQRARSWYLDHGVTVSVNVSAHQLRDARFPTVVAEALHASGLPGVGLVVEITESAVAAGTPEETALVRERLDRIRELGTRVAIDDFGTGYSSLAYLRQLPAEILKVDRAFVVGNGPGASSDREFLRAILQLASSVRMQTVAEGVETEEQARLLRMLGYPLAQGFLFHRPQPAGSIDTLLASVGRQRVPAVQ